ncbi:hypothetical protein EON65_42380 [archaeon]|nr:MAG: hypothetical protein EON65_42380 [archaeon]
MGWLCLLSASSPLGHLKVDTFHLTCLGGYLLGCGRGSLGRLSICCGTGAHPESAGRFGYGAVRGKASSFQSRLCT